MANLSRDPADFAKANDAHSLTVKKDIHEATR